MLVEAFPHKSLVVPKPSRGCQSCLVERGRISRSPASHLGPHFLILTNSSDYSRPILVTLVEPSGPLPNV